MSPNPMMSALRSWSTLSQRERRLVLGAALLVGGALIWLLLLEPAWSGRTRLLTELPRLRMQAARMVALAAEAKQSSATSATRGAPQALRDAVRQSARAAGLTPDPLAAGATGELVEVRFGRVSHAAWTDWLDALLRETHARVSDLTLTRLDAPDMVSVRLVLQAAGRDRP